MSRDILEAAVTLRDASATEIQTIALHDWDMIRDLATMFIARSNMLTEAHDKWEECLKEISRQKEHIAGLQAALRTVQREQADT